ncbi:MAG: acyl carrier protein [Methylobacteriaceae bacterium]|nr:acyl carrier protein [Methylobacteriaceae bacterium]
MLDTIRQLIDKHARLPVKAETLAAGQDLYAAGLTSFAAVQLMLALEESFDIEFPERMLNRRSFATMESIAACIQELRPQAIAS